MAERSQNESFTIKGHWWLPGTDFKVAGDLIYDEEEMELALYGGLNLAVVDSPLCAMPEAWEFPMIYGESLDGVPVTLLQSFYTEVTPDIRLESRAGTKVVIRSSQLSSNLMLVGIHLASPEIRFRKYRAEIAFLET